MLWGSTTRDLKGSSVQLHDDGSGSCNFVKEGEISYTAERLSVFKALLASCSYEISVSGSNATGILTRICSPSFTSLGCSCLCRTKRSASKTASTPPDTRTLSTTHFLRKTEIFSVPKT